MTSMSYTNNCLPIPPHCYPDPYETQSPQRPETSRKRPKYTRSKTGCLTCRVKKIKCDETKPNCMRCTHGSRECTWPEGVPVRKKSTAKRDSIDGRPSTAESSGRSDTSTPPTREHTPPRRTQLDMNILPPPLRSPSNNFIHMQAMSSNHSSDHSLIRRQPERGSVYMPQPSNPNILSMIPESPYPPRYNHSCDHSSHPSRHTMSGSYRTLSQQPTSHWSPPSEVFNPYYHNNVHERTMLGHSPPNEHSSDRYQ